MEQHFTEQQQNELIRVFNGQQPDRATITDEEDIAFDTDKTHRERLKQLASLQKKKKRLDRGYQPGAQQLVRVDPVLSIIIRAYANSLKCSPDEIATYMLREHLEGGVGHAIFETIMEKGLAFSDLSKHNEADSPRQPARSRTKRSTQKAAVIPIRRS